MDANRLFQEYERGKRYKEAIGLYDTVNRNEDFYIGNQWRGLQAPDLDKPVLNFLRRVASYMIAMLVSDDVKANFSAPGGVSEAICEALGAEIDRIFERCHMASVNRDALRDAVVRGDAVLHVYSETGDKTDIKAELMPNTNLVFGNPYTDEMQKQPYLIAVQYLHIDEVKKDAPAELKELIKPDGEGAWAANEQATADDKRVTVLTRYFKKNGVVHYMKAVREGILKEETALGYALYPFAVLRWDRVQDSCHGQAALTAVIPNQIMVNKLWAMMLRYQQLNAFPKIIYDQTKIARWSNRVDAAIAVNGAVSDAVGAAYNPPQMGGAVLEVVERLIQKSMEMMGATDAALGNVRPDNTSAILAVQKSSAAPLELQKLAFYQFVEDAVRIMAEIMRCDYGLRLVPGKEVQFDPLTGMEQKVDTWREIDFSMIDIDGLDLKVDVGPSAYWSEIMQMRTMDNLFANGIVTDPVTYLEGIPDAYVKNKHKLIKDLKERMEQAASSVRPLETGESQALTDAETLIGRIEDGLSGM